MMNTVKVLFLFGSIALIAWSCSDSVSPDNENKVWKAPYANARKVLPTTDSSSSAADSTIDFAKRIPGFGGMFISNSGQFTIYLTHPPEQKAKAREVLLSSKLIKTTLSHIRAEGEAYSKASVADMAIKKGRYTFIQLHTWRNKIPDVDGVYSKGIDQSINKGSIGVKNKAVRNTVSKKLSQLNIPTDAVVFHQMTPPEFY